MAKFNYTKMRTMASNLLSQFGNSFILKKPEGSAVYNPKTKKTDQIYKEYTGKCVMKTYTAETIGMMSNIINAGDVAFVCTMDDIKVIPEENKDKIVYGGISYNIIDIATSNPNGSTIIIHTLHCRRVTK